MYQVLDQQNTTPTVDGENWWDFLKNMGLIHLSFPSLMTENLFPGERVGQWRLSSKRIVRNWRIYLTKGLMRTLHFGVIVVDVINVELKYQKKKTPDKIRGFSFLGFILLVTKNEMQPIPKTGPKSYSENEKLASVRWVAPLCLWTVWNTPSIRF